MLINPNSTDCVELLQAQVKLLIAIAQLLGVQVEIE